MQLCLIPNVLRGDYNNNNNCLCLEINAAKCWTCWAIACIAAAYDWSHATPGTMLCEMSMTRIGIKWNTRWWWINRNMWCVSFENIRNSFRIIAFACIAKLNRWPVTRWMDSRIVQRRWAVRMQTQRQSYQLQLMQMMRTSNYFSSFLSVAVESLHFRFSSLCRF